MAWTADRSTCRVIRSCLAIITIYSPRWRRCRVDDPQPSYCPKKLSFTTVSPIRNNYQGQKDGGGRSDHIEWRQFHNESSRKGLVLR